MASFAREVARRVYAQELRDSDLSFRENEDQYAPLYLITPTGARCNRVLVVGTLTERDNLGDDVEYWRGRVADPRAASSSTPASTSPTPPRLWREPSLRPSSPSWASPASTRPRTGRG